MVKFINITNAASKNLSIEEIRNEADVMSKLSHNYVARLIDHCQGDVHPEIYVLPR
jgi:serine/threonine protein kinase